MSVPTSSCALRPYQQWLVEKAVAMFLGQSRNGAGELENPTDDELRQFDRTRPGKTVFNDDWENPHDPDATITRMKDGTTRMAYKVEHAVDLDSDIVVPHGNPRRANEFQFECVVIARRWP
jgi:hypothetical protein